MPTFKPHNPCGDTEIRRRNLPHWTADGACYFITFRLADSLPQALLAQWNDERAVWLKWHPEPWTEKERAEYEERFPQRREYWLDAGYGDCQLRRADVRELVAASVRKFDAVRYDLDAFILMPNHVHLLWQLRGGIDLSKEMKGLKGASARACNTLLGRAGTFWMDESYDHIVRDSVELSAFRAYIAANPEKAGLQPHEYMLEIRNILEVEQ